MGAHATVGARLVAAGKDRGSVWHSLGTDEKGAATIRSAKVDKSEL
jgi:hypothetical protein